ncbi:MAG: hypothetical protein ACK6DB_10710, partial [Planctomycetota bacterium]
APSGPYLSQTAPRGLKRSRAADIASQTGISIKTKNRIPHGLAQKQSLAQKLSLTKKHSLTKNSV